MLSKSFSIIICCAVLVTKRSYCFQAMRFYSKFCHHSFVCHFYLYLHQNVLVLLNSVSDRRKPWSCWNLRIGDLSATVVILTHFSSVSHFYTPRERQKTKGFLTFSGGKKCETGLKWVKLLPLTGIIKCLSPGKTSMSPNWVLLILWVIILQKSFPLPTTFHKMDSLT